jgi:hypothetical protein
VNGRWKDYTEVMKSNTLKRILCDELYCDFYRYDY